MNRIPMSAAAAGLLRALIERAGVPRDRILLTDIQSTDWRSLTFTGERHQFDLRIPPPDDKLAIECLCTGLEDCEFSIPGVIVADVGAVGPAEQEPDGSMCLTIEALTVNDD